MLRSCTPLKDISAWRGWWRSDTPQEVASRAESASRYPNGLTVREVEVLGLLAGGKTNREIAESLFISVRTASNHVSNIFAKINAANRAEAATYANRQGLA